MKRVPRARAPLFGAVALGALAAVALPRLVAGLRGKESAGTARASTREIGAAGMPPHFDLSAFADPRGPAGSAGSLAGAEFAAFSRRVFGAGVGLPGLSAFGPVGAAHQAVKARRIAAFCDRVDAQYARLGWGTSPCHALPWTFERLSENGHPLVFWDYSGLETPVRPERHLKDETTLVLGGVHPDEITPVHLAFRFAEELLREPGIYSERRVVIAPLVNPDGFFVRNYTRTNANGVDLNRNFATRDWWAYATKLWHARRKADPRHFPGFAPQTEEGTRFQVDLLERYDVDKVISVHAPLGFLDYDGPGDTKERNLSRNEKRARELANIVSRSSKNYSIRDFVFYPGSLGNYTGNERFIPTVTLELQSTDPRLARKYWTDFSPGLVAAVRYDFVKSTLAKAESPAEEKKSR